MCFHKTQLYGIFTFTLYHFEVVIKTNGIRIVISSSEKARYKYIHILSIAIEDSINAFIICKF